MTVLRLRLALLLAVVVLTLASVASQAAGDEGRSPCLSRRVGDLLSEKLAAHTFDGALPTDWRLQELSVDRDHIDLGTLDAQGLPHRVALRMGRDSGRMPDGRGRRFSFFIEPSGTPLDAEGRRGLLDLARRVDEAVPEDEALRRCTAGPPGDAGPPSAAGPEEKRSWLERGGLFPRWVALSVGAFEVLLVVVALVFARRVRFRDSAHSASDIWFDFAVFVIAWVALRGSGGGSPILWIDTMNDQRDVHRCLLGACTTLGEATSVDGVYHAAGWLDILSVAAAAGLGLDTVHLVLQALSAVAVMIAASTARNAAGRFAGVLSGLICLGFVGKAVNVQALYNTTPLPFLGAVFLLVGVASVRRPGLGSISVLAMIGAALTSVHAACVVSFVSVVWIARLAPRDRGRLTSIGAAVFIVSAVAVGPAGWGTTLRHVLSVVTGHGGSQQAAVAGRLVPLATYGALGALAVVARRVARAEQRTLAEVALAITLPMLAASFAAAAVSSVPTNAKYLAHAAPSGAVLVATLAMAASARISRRSTQATDGAIRATWIVLALSCVAIVCSGLTRFPFPMLVGHARPFTFHEAAGIPAVLAARGWTYARVYRSLRSPYAAEVLASFEMLAPAFPVGPPPGDSMAVYVAKIESRSVPTPLPDDWAVASHDASWTVVLVFTRSFLSWGRFEACDRRAADGNDACVESGLALGDDEKPRCVYCVRGMPPFQRPGEHALELRMSVRADPGETSAIAMPSPRPLLCGGSIVSVPGGPTSISPDRKRATWVAPAGDRSSDEVRLDWTIGSPECDMNAYSGLPPFFLEGAPDAVEQLEGLEF